MSRALLSLPLWLLLPLLTGCLSQPLQQRDLAPNGGEYDIRMLAKSDMSRVAELGQREVLKSLRLMMVELYRANPEELNRGSADTLTGKVEQIFGAEIRWIFPEFQGVRGNSVLHLAFDPQYRGDRVLAFTAALVSMTMRSYNGTTELYLLDRLDPQKIYNSARNFEIAQRLLNQRRQSQMLDQAGRGVANHLQRAVANQDLMALLIADHTSRRITGVLQSVAATVLLPI